MIEEIDLAAKIKEIYYEALVFGFDLAGVVDAKWSNEINLYHLARGFALSNNKYAFLSDLNKLEESPKEIRFYKEMLEADHPIGSKLKYSVRGNIVVTFSNFYGDTYRSIEYEAMYFESLITIVSMTEDGKMKYAKYVVCSTVIADLLTEKSLDKILGDKNLMKDMYFVSKNTKSI